LDVPPRKNNSKSTSYCCNDKYKQQINPDSHVYGGEPKSLIEERCKKWQESNQHP